MQEAPETKAFVGPSSASSAITPLAQAYAFLLAGGICLGTSPVVVKALPLTADVSAFYRVALSAPLFCAWAMLSVSRPGASPGRSRAGGSVPSWRLYALAALLFAADLLTMHMAIRLTNASVATLFTNCAPFFVGVLGLLGLSDRPTRTFWMALPLALAGIVLLMGLSVTDQANGPLGDAIALLAAFFYGAYLVTVRHLKQRGARSSDIMASVTAGSAVLLAPLMFGQEQVLPPDMHTLILLSILALVGQVAGQGLVTVALRTLPVTSSSIVLLIQPAIAAPLAWLALGEALSALQIFGMGLVLISIGLATRPVATVSCES